MKRTKDCLVCSGESIPIKELEKSSIYKCGSCRLEFASPTPSEKELREFYEGYKYHTEYDERLVDETTSRNAEKDIASLESEGLSRQSRLLDFGCGKNLFVKRGNSPNWFGYDYPSGEIPDGKFDFITLWGVLEHLANPVEVLKGLSARLNRRGKIVMTTVSTETGVPYRHRFPVHLTWWTNNSVERILDIAGFEKPKISPYLMLQNPQFYLDRVLDRGQVPEGIKRLISIDVKDYILVPTNEICVVGEK